MRVDERMPHVQAGCDLVTIPVFVGDSGVGKVAGTRRIGAPARLSCTLDT
jgi:hypothetical protein